MAEPVDRLVTLVVEPERGDPATEVTLVRGLTTFDAFEADITVNGQKAHLRLTITPKLVIAESDELNQERKP